MRSREEHEARCAARYREAKETKQRGKGDEKSETLVVPRKPENSPHEDPVEGRGVQFIDRTGERCRSL